MTKQTDKSKSWDNLQGHKLSFFQQELTWDIQQIIYLNWTPIQANQPG